MTITLKNYKISAFLVIFSAFIASSAPLPTAIDLRETIRGQLKSGKKQVIILPGRYLVAPDHGTCLTFKNLTNIDIVATGAEMVCTETSRALSFENCHNVRLTGLTIDYDPLPFTEARISGLAPDRSWAQVEVPEGYPAFAIAGAVEIFDPGTGELRRATSVWSANVADLGYGSYLINKPEGYHYDPERDTEEAGDVVVVNHLSARGAGGHAVEAFHCQGLKLEDLTLFASPCFGFLERDCKGTVYRRCKIDRRPLETDPVRRGLRRFRSLNADAFHSIDATKGPSIIDCTACFQGDDCVNIHGTYYLALGSRGNQIRAAAVHEPVLQAGDAVAFIPWHGPRPGDARALKIEPDAPLSAEETAFIGKQSLDEGIRRELLGPHAHIFSVTLDHPVPLEMGCGLCARDRVGNGCEVRGCDFGFNRSRGIIIKASSAKVTGNKITHTWMAGVLVGPEFFWWLEAGCPEHVLVTGNTFVGCRSAGIEVAAQGGDGNQLPASALRGIDVHDNAVVQTIHPLEVLLEK